MRIFAVYQFIFLSSAPAFNLFFPFQCHTNITSIFIINQLVNLMFCSKTVRISILTVLIDTASKISCYPGINSGICIVRKNIDIIIHNISLF